MTVSSAQISGLVGGQQAMFHNQAVAAQNVSGLYGLGQLGNVPSQPMPNPYPTDPLGGPTYARPSWNYQTDYGNRAAGALGMSLPAAAMGVGIAGSMIGGRGAFLEPFTGVASAFRSGTGATLGAGVGGTLRGIGSAFSQGGFRAGMGVLGGGLAAGAAAAIPYYMAGKAISSVGENIYAGAQHVQQVGQMAKEYMDPTWGPGSHRGGQRGRGHIRGMVGVLQEIASEDVMQDMESLKRIMDQAGRSGMLSGVQDVRQFRDKFRGIIERSKAVAKALGTSLQEAMPLMQQMGRMGLWTSQDILGTSVAVKAAGPGASGELMGAMQSGAQMSSQMGGSRRTGGILGREIFGTMQSAIRSGAITQNQMAEFTGGATGAAGQRVSAQKMMGIMQRFGQSSMGQLMLAGLGQTEEDERGRRVYTGKIDEEMMEKFQRGEVSVDELISRGEKLSQGSQEGAASFEFHRAGIGQEMLAQGGVSGLNEALKRVMEKARPGAGENVRKMFAKLQLGVGSKEVEMLKKLADEQERIASFKEQETERVLSDSLRQLEERQFRSLSGLKDVIGHTFDESIKPLQELGSDLATSLGETSDKVVNWFFGRTREITMSNKERLNLFRSSMEEKTGKMRLDMPTRPSTEPLGGTVPGGGSADAFGARGPGWSMMRGVEELTMEHPGVLQGQEALVRPISMQEASALRPGQDWLTPGGFSGVNIAMHKEGWGGLVYGGGYAGSRAEALRTLGARPKLRSESQADNPAYGEMIGPSPLKGMVDVYNMEQVTEIMERGYKRQSDPTLAGLFGRKANTRANQQSVRVLQGALRSMQSDRGVTDPLRALERRGKTAEYNRGVVKAFLEQEGVREELEKMGVNPEDEQAVRDAMAVAQRQGEGVSGVVLKETQGVEMLGVMTPGHMETTQEENIELIQKALSGKGRWIYPESGYAYMEDSVKAAGIDDDELVGMLADYGEEAAEFTHAVSTGAINDPAVMDRLSKENSLYRAAFSTGGENTPAGKFVRYLLDNPSRAEDVMGAVGGEEGVGGLREFVGIRMDLANKETFKKINTVAKKQAAISEKVSGNARKLLQGAVNAYKDVGSREDLRKAFSGIEAAAKKLSGKDVKRLSEGKEGTAGRMAAGVRRLGEVTEGMSAKEFRAFQAQLGDVLGVGEQIENLMRPEERDRLTEMLASGKGLEGTEVGEATDILKGAIQQMPGVTGSRGQKGINADLMSQLSMYTKANSAFVQVVGESLSKISDAKVDDVVNTIKGMGKEVSQ